MREILFRGLTTNGEFVFGSLVNTTRGIKHMPNQQSKTWIVTSAFGNGGWFNVQGRSYVRPETVGQFTGLTDCDGVKIFEGDIVAGKSKIFGMILGAVCMSEYNDNDGYMHEKHFGLNVMGIPLIDLINDGLSIIGNIHQNPELLEHTNANHN